MRGKLLRQLVNRTFQRASVKCGFSSRWPDMPELNQKQKVIDDFERTAE